MKAAPADLSTVLILRHNAIILAMQHRQIARGAVELACSLALQDLVAVIAKADGISEVLFRQVCGETESNLAPGDSSRR